MRVEAETGEKSNIIRFPERGTLGELPKKKSIMRKGKEILNVAAKAAVEISKHKPPSLFSYRSLQSESIVQRIHDTPPVDIGGKVVEFKLKKPRL